MTDQRHSDERWMAQVAKGDREALEPLVRRFAVPLLTFLERMVGDRHKSEELFQEVFLAVWKHRTQYEYPRPFKPWLFAIAVNQCRAAFRLKKLPMAPMEETALAVVGEPSPAEALVATETAALVAHAVTQLPPQQRAVVSLRVWQELTYQDIADILDTTQGTVRAHMHHGLTALRKYLEPRLS